MASATGLRRRRSATSLGRSKGEQVYQMGYRGEALDGGMGGVPPYYDWVAPFAQGKESWCRLQRGSGFAVRLPSIEEEVRGLETRGFAIWHVTDSSLKRVLEGWQAPRAYRTSPQRVV